MEHLAAAEVQADVRRMPEHANGDDVSSLWILHRPSVQVEERQKHSGLPLLGDPIGEVGELDALHRERLPDHGEASEGLDVGAPDQALEAFHPAK